MLPVIHAKSQLHETPFILGEKLTILGQVATGQFRKQMQLSIPGGTHQVQNIPSVLTKEVQQFSVKFGHKRLFKNMWVF